MQFLTTFTQTSGIKIYRKYILKTFWVFGFFFQLLGSTFFSKRQNKHKISCQQPGWSCCFPAGPKAVTGTTGPSPPGTCSNRAGRCFWRLTRKSLLQQIHGMHSACLCQVLPFGSSSSSVDCTWNFKLQNTLKFRQQELTNITPAVEGGLVFPSKSILC